MNEIFWIHFAVTWALIGTAWFVQIVHNPTLRFLPKDAARNLEAFNRRRSSYFAFPLMGAEALTAALLAVYLTGEPGWFMLFINTLLIGAVWILSLFLLFPRFFPPLTIKSFNRFISIHFLRLFLWSFRGFLLLTFLDRYSK